MTPDDWHAAQPHMYSIFGPPLELLGAKMLMTFPVNARGTVSKEPIRKPEDMKGVILRAPTTADWECTKAVGGTPARIAAGEAYDAFAKGSIHAINTNMDSIWMRKWYEPAKYMLFPTGTTGFFLWVNLKTWNKLPADVQKAITALCKEYEERGLEAAKAKEKEQLAELGKTLTIYKLTAGDLKEWTARVAPAYDEYLKKSEKAGYGTQARKLLDALTK